ncbi:HNH endonuclease signature motif containing protein [Catellatospora sp. NPDC049111]|uniref:HNH endonuclease signature motif containing protein n=1 Tax=Catellatospora sp. NPDC049111 TaxID=3155271 RepID=UPI003401D171
MALKRRTLSRRVKPVEPELWPHGVVMPTPTGRVRKSYEIDEATSCWIYQGAKDRDGYGLVNDRTHSTKTTRPAHRFFWLKWVGAVPEGMELHHKCRVRACVNPSHLQVVTHGENVALAKQHRVKKTHCPRWHRYTKRNTYKQKGGRRSCKTCVLARGYAKNNGVSLRKALRHQERRFGRPDLRAIIRAVDGAGTLR